MSNDPKDGQAFHDRQDLARYHQARWLGVRGSELKALVCLAWLLAGVAQRELTDNELRQLSDAVHELWGGGR